MQIFCHTINLTLLMGQCLSTDLIPSLVASMHLFLAQKMDNYSKKEMRNHASRSLTKS